MTVRVKARMRPLEELVSKCKCSILTKRFEGIVIAYPETTYKQVMRCVACGVTSEEQVMNIDPVMWPGFGECNFIVVDVFEFDEGLAE